MRLKGKHPDSQRKFDVFIGSMIDNVRLRCATPARASTGREQNQAWAWHTKSGDYLSEGQ